MTYIPLKKLEKEKQMQQEKKLGEEGRREGKEKEEEQINPFLEHRQILTRNG